MARRRRTARKRAAQGKQGLTLNTVTLIAYLLFVFIFALALYFSQQVSFGQIRIQQHSAKASISHSIAFQLSKAVESYAHALESMARDPALIELLQNGDRAAIAKRSAQLYKAFPLAVALRIYPVGTARLDRTVKPQISYACLDLFGLVEQGERTPPVEVHVPKTADQHLEVVRPVYNGKRLIGFIQLALKVQAIQVWINSVISNNYVELVQVADSQKPILIGRGGDDQLRVGAASYYKVPGTRWEVAVWSKSAVSVLPITFESLFIFLASVAILGLALFYMKRSLSSSISLDAQNIIRMTADRLLGRKQHDYQLFMPEFLDAARNIDSVRTSNDVIDRERDDDPNAISFSQDDLNNIDPLYNMGEGVSVEEVDEDSMVEAMRQQAQSQLASAPDTVRAGSASNLQQALQNSIARQGSPSNDSAQQKAVFEARESINESSTQHNVSSVRQAPPALPPVEIFKAYDIRGIVGSTLTAAHAVLIGRAVGSEARDRGLTRMAFARDGRLSGPELGQAFVTGVKQAGIDVLDIGMVPTPVLYFAATMETDGTGVMLTGSHNPPDYNGFKMMLGGETLSGDAIRALHERIEQQRFHSGDGQYSNKGVGKAYIDRIISDVKLKKPLNVVIDCGNGVAGAIAPLLFKSMGCRVTELYCDVDGHFPNHHPDPSKPENMQDLIAAVKQKNADIGLAFDGDGDRLGVIDAQGNMIYPDRIMMLLAADVLKRNPGAQIIFDIKCSSNLTKVIWEKGGEPVMWKTGHSLIKSKMKQSGAALAGEMSGHIFFSERWLGFDDGMYSGARLLEVLSGLPQKSDEVFAALPDAVNTPEINVKMKEGEHHKFIEDLMMQADFGNANVTMIDGIRADYEDGWGLVRASNTTPVLVLRFEGRDATAMKRIQTVFKAQMLNIRADLNLPF